MANEFDIRTVPFCETSASEHDVGFLFSFGAYGDTHVVVLAAHLEDALESALEWLDDNAPGLLHTIGPAQYEEAAKELGIPWNRGIVNSADMDRICEIAEADMTMVTHTTLEHGNCIPSWEWHVRELMADELKIVKARKEKLDEES